MAVSASKRLEGFGDQRRYGCCDGWPRGSFRRSKVPEVGRKGQSSVEQEKKALKEEISDCQCKKVGQISEGFLISAWGWILTEAPQCTSRVKPASQGKSRTIQLSDGNVLCHLGVSHKHLLTAPSAPRDIGGSGLEIWTERINVDIPLKQAEKLVRMQSDSFDVLVVVSLEEISTIPSM